MALAYGKRLMSGCPPSSLNMALIFSQGLLLDNFLFSSCTNASFIVCLSPFIVCLFLRASKSSKMQYLIEYHSGT